MQADDSTESAEQFLVSCEYSDIGKEGNSVFSIFVGGVDNPYRLNLTVVTVFNLKDDKV